MLDISIGSADKIVNSPKKIHQFLFSHCVVEAKLDGVKLTVLKISNNGNLSDYIFAYKGNILYPGEYDYLDKTKIKTESIGASQFQIVFDHFSKLKINSIPVGTELQVEFLMSKPTLSSNYTKKHEMVLIGYSKSSFKTSFGKLVTENSEMQTEKRDQFAKELKINTPLKIFDGILGTEKSFCNGILDNRLRKIFSDHSLIWKNEKNVFENLKSIFLELPSIFGGKEEGVVIKFDDGKILKWQQSYQTDQSARLQIKQNFREDSFEKETKYWRDVKLAAFEILNHIETKNIIDSLKNLASILKNYQPQFQHSKKTATNIKDDIQLSAKTLILKFLKGNNGCLVIGKFRILTSGHYKLIQDALKNFDRVAVCVVTGLEIKKSKQIRLKQIKECFGDKVDIVEHQNGNVVRIMEKIPFNINVVYTGSDRVQDYLRQLSTSLGVLVNEMKRTSQDISASKIIFRIHDEEFFKANTPKQIHKFYPQILNLYKED